MDCNREEAVRARALAEQKLASQDYVSAKKYAVKAQQLFPGLDNMGHMMAVIDVHMAALVKVGASNEMDWYAILQVEPNADEVAVKKQYRKLALFLHPDKNKLAGAESAFKLIGEASQVLSDKTSRLAYNAKRSRAQARSSQRTPVRSTRGAGGNKNYPEQNGYGGASANAQQFKAARAQAQLHPLTFWTACPFCQMRYQYYRKFENQNLLCPQCRKAFLARDLSRPHPPQAPFSQTDQPKAESTAGTAGPNGCANGSQKFPNTTTPAYTTEAHSTDLPNGNKVAKNAEAEKELRRKVDEFFKSKEVYEDLPRQKEQTSSTQSTGCATNLANESKTAEKAEVKVADTAADLPNGNKVAEEARTEKEHLRKADDIRRWMELQREMAKRKEQLKSTTTTERSRGEPGQAKMEEQGGTAASSKKENKEKVSSKAKRKRGKKQHRSNDSETEEEEEEEDWEKVAADWKREEQPRRSSRAKGNVTYKCNESDDDFQSTPLKKKARAEKEVDPFPPQQHHSPHTSTKLADLAKNAIKTKVNLQGTFAASVVHDAKAGFKTCPEGEVKPKHEESETECLNPTDGGSRASSDLQEPEFHRFDEGREEKDVEVGQVWALYDDKDGMPKYYMKVKAVQSRTPFQVSVGWFEVRKPSEEISELLDSGFSVTCGEFIMSSSQIIHNVNSFSHRVNWVKAGKGIIRVYPKKGEIWCMFVDWKCERQVFKVNDIPSTHCMVEVLADCNEASGVTAMLLKKVQGHKVLFQSSGAGVIQVPFLEVLRFSHQVPAYKMKGDEAPNLPNGCWELDSAAIPSSLICPEAAASLHS